MMHVGNAMISGGAPPSGELRTVLPSSGSVLGRNGRDTDETDSWITRLASSTLHRARIGKSQIA